MASCGCKGIRTCLICERGIEAVKNGHPITSTSHHMCYKCGSVFSTNSAPSDTDPPLQLCSTECSDDKLTLQPTYVVGDYPSTGGLSDFGGVTKASACVCGFSGVTVVKEFVSVEEERGIVTEINERKWAQSQSGRRKQDYGPKVNFKRQKVKLGTFNGLPLFSKTLIQRMHSTLPQLVNFEPVELCNLEYAPDRGSSIDPHCDDSWLWGERLVTLNLLSHTLLTFSTPPHPHESTSSEYSTGIVDHLGPPTQALHDLPSSHTLQDTPQDPPPSHTLQDTPQDPPPSHTLQDTPQDPPPSYMELHVPLPRRSLVIVSGLARHVWHHSIKREHIVSRRVAVTLRELTPEFQEGGTNYEVGKSLLEIASKFDGHPINFA